MVLHTSAVAGSSQAYELYWPDGICNVENGMAYPGNDIQVIESGENVQVTSGKDCATHCIRRVDCFAFTYIVGTCFLKSAVDTNRSQPAVGFTSGTCGRVPMTIPFGIDIPANESSRDRVRINDCGAVSCPNLCRFNCGWNQAELVTQGEQRCGVGYTSTTTIGHDLSACNVPPSTPAQSTASPDPDILCAEAGESSINPAQ